VTAIVGGQTAEKAQIIVIASSDVTIQWGDSSVFHQVMGEIFTTTDRMIANFPCEPGHIRHEIHDPFTIRPLLANPLQEIDLCYLLILAL